jgi:hypothetical protein
MITQSFRSAEALALPGIGVHGIGGSALAEITMIRRPREKKSRSGGSRGDS